MNIYKREKYLRRLRGFFHDTEMIKVITGVRRCGKSCLMASIADELRETGIPDSQILFLDLDSKKYRKVKTPDQLDALIEGARAGNGTIYVFIDEVQNVKGFEEVINAYRTDGGYSIFITGSNSYLLSGELSTKLTGRYIELEMYPLSFDEYLGMKAFMGKPIQNNLTAEFDSYILEGGFPKALQYDSMEDKRTYTRSVISEIFEKDIRQRVKVRNKAVFESVRTYLLNNFGATTSLNNILKDLEKQGVHIKRETLNRYIKILQDAKILYRCNRFDLKSRRSLAGEQKYYLADCAFYFAMNTDNRINYRFTRFHMTSRECISFPVLAHTILKQIPLLVMNQAQYSQFSYFCSTHLFSLFLVTPFRLHRDNHRILPCGNSHFQAAWP